MKKIIWAVVIGMAFTVLTNWISSREIKNEAKAKQEKLIEKKAEQSLLKKWDKYTGDWVSQDDAAIRINITKQNQKIDSFYKVTIYQNGNQTYTFSLQLKSNGQGEVTNEKGTFNLEFTNFYEKSSKKLKPSIEIYRVGNGTENASDKNFFIRAFR